MSHTLSMPFRWSDQGTSRKMDVMCLIFALLLHAPLLHVKLELRKKSVDSLGKRIDNIDLLDEMPVPKEKEPPPAPAKGDGGLLGKLRMLAKREPPPPPPPKPKTPDALSTPANQIKLEPKLDMNQKIQPKLESKSGFKATNPELVKQKQIDLKTMGTGVIAPLSASKLGALDPKTPTKQDRGNFQVAKNSVSDIGGDTGPGLKMTNAPTIAIATGKKGTSENFSAPPPQKADKGSFQGGATGSLSGGGTPKMGLRDQMLAKYQAPIDVGGQEGGVAGGVPGGVPGGLGTKKDAGRYDDGGGTGSLGTGSPKGMAGGIGTIGTGKTVGGAGAIAKKPTKSGMFEITGPLKDRPIRYKEIPQYPAWAQQQGVEASVILEFTVTPDGKVKNQIVVRRTSGYPRLDDSAMNALRKWVFAPLAEGSNRNEVGYITFNYTLN